MFYMSIGVGPDTIGHMTDQPPDERSAEPTAPTPATPNSLTVISPTPAPIEAPNEASGGVGFAAIRPPGQPDPPPGPPGFQTPPPGYVQGPPPGPPPGWSQPPNYQGPPPGYQGPPPGYPPPGYPPPGYGYAAPPPAPRTGPSVVLMGVVALVLVLVVGIGGLFAFGIGPFARATPTPFARATTAPTPLVTVPPTAIVAPSNGATAAPTATAGPTATPLPSGDVVAALLTHIPPDFADACFVSPGGSPIVAIASCTADDGAIEVTYFQYDSQESMFQAYEGFRLTSEIEPDTGSCGDPTTWPAENDYNIAEQPAGRLLCTEALGQTSIYWTDDRLNILSQATHTTSDFARLVEFWETESGPNV